MILNAQRPGREYSPCPAQRHRPYINEGKGGVIGYDTHVIGRKQRVRMVGEGAEVLVRRLQADPDWRERLVHVESFPARPPAYEAIDLAPAVLEMLKDRGIDRLYTHQARAIKSIRAGAPTAVATPTASGKSLIYLIPCFESRLAGEESHALYLSPLKALAQDQRRLVTELNASLPAGQRLAAELYDGDTPSGKRAKIRSSPPALVLSNPDMLHASLLAFHHAWRPFFQGLKYVVLDEAHTYRGVFGSHVSGIMRRLKRVCAHYGSNPKFIVTSATLSNAAEFLLGLTGEEFTVVSESGAPSPPRFFALVRPEGSVYTESCELLRRTGHSILVYLFCTGAFSVLDAGI